MSLCLTTEEIQALTGKVRQCAQARELDHLGIPYRARRDGSLLVMRIHAEAGATIPREPQLRLGNG